MGWKNWSSWVKGGVILGILGFIIFFLIARSISDNLTALTFFIFGFVLIIPIIIIILFLVGAISIIIGKIKSRNQTQNINNQGIIEMVWNWPAWVRGGMISIFIIVLLTIGLIPLGFGEGHPSFPLSFILLMLPAMIIVLIEEWILPIPTGFTYSLNFVFIFSLTFYFLIGALIGFIIEKIKSKNQNINNQRIIKRR